MDAAVLHTFWKPPRYEQFPEPIAGEGEVIVSVRAASLKPVDQQMYKVFGIDWKKAYDTPIGRPIKIANSLVDLTAEPIRELL